MFNLPRAGKEFEGPRDWPSHGMYTAWPLSCAKHSAAIRRTWPVERGPSNAGEADRGIANAIRRLVAVAGARRWDSKPREGEQEPRRAGVLSQVSPSPAAEHRLAGSTTGVDLLGGISIRPSAFSLRVDYWGLHSCDTLFLLIFRDLGAKMFQDFDFIRKGTLRIET